MNIDPLHWAKTHRKHTTLIIQIAFLTFLALLVALMFLGTTSTAVAEMDTWKTPVVKAPTITTQSLSKTSPKETPPQVHTTKPEVEARIRAIGQELGLTQAQINRAIRIGYCESGLNPNAHGDSGRSHGVWQIFQPAHKDIPESLARDVEWSTRWSLTMMKKGLWSRWTCARWN